MRGFACIGLYNPKHLVNVGEVLRAAHCYRADLVVAAGGCRYRDTCTDTSKAYRHIPFLEVDELSMVLPRACVAVAVEMTEGARPLPTYIHPERALYVFGPEDGSLPPEVLGWCRDVVSIPTAYCLNLGATVNVVLYDRLAKRRNRSLKEKFTLYN